MNALAIDVHDKAPQPVGLLVTTRLLPGMASALMLAPALLAYEVPRTVAMVLVALLWVQVVLLGLGAMSLVGSAHERLRPWEGRVAPDAARRRVRARLLRDLGWMAVLGLSGPLVLGAMLDVQAGELRRLPGVLALLSVALCGGLVWSLGWCGRAPRALMPAALGLLAMLMWPDVVRAVSHGGLLQSLAVLGCTGLVWGWLLRRRALVARAQPLPRLNPTGWWRRWGAHRLWRSVPYRISAHEYRRFNFTPWVLLVFVPQFQMHASRMAWLSWGQAYSHPYAMLGYGLWLLAISILAAALLIAPPLHWRHRLAPGGLTTRRWGRRLVLGSMLAFTAGIGMALAVATLANRLPFWPVDASACASAVGDVLLATAFVAWQRARFTRKMGLMVLPVLAAAAAVVLGMLTLLGLTPERGLVWLCIQMLLTVAFARAAVRAWSRHDLNAMA